MSVSAQERDAWSSAFGAIAGALTVAAGGDASQANAFNRVGTTLGGAFLAANTKPPESERTGQAIDTSAPPGDRTQQPKGAGILPRMGTIVVVGVVAVVGLLAGWLVLRALR